MLRWKGRQDRQGSEKRWGRVGVGEASCEVERDRRKWMVQDMLKVTKWMNYKCN